MDENNSPVLKEEKPVSSKKPTGLIILGWLNLGLRGIFMGLLFVLLYFTLTPQIVDQLLAAIKTQGINITLSLSQFKIVIVTQIVMSIVFIISGAGLLAKKEWARQLTLSYSFFIILMAFISTVLSPAMAGQAILEAIYPGILVIYLTNKNVISYFKGK